MSDKQYLLDENALAARWAISVKALQAWRWRGDGCPYIKIGKRLVRYRISDVQAFELAGARDHTAFKVGGLQS